MNPQDHIEALLELAAKSPCSRDKRGALVVRGGEVIGRGFNAPVGGACSDAVCHQIVRRDGWAEPVVRSCGGHVEHAESMAMRRAMCGIAVKLAHSECDGRTADEGALFANVAHDRPLNGCELIHLNTGPEDRPCEHCAGRAEGGNVAWSCERCGWIAGLIPFRVAQPSRRRGCPSCAVLASGFGVSAIWLLHDEGWERWPMAEYSALSGVV